MSPAELQKGLASAGLYLGKIDGIWGGGSRSAWETLLALGHPNMRAFFDLLAYAEGTSTSPATRMMGYDVIVTGADGKPETFRDFSTHPFAKGRASKVINSRGLTSNASGRYQFMLKDWAHYRDLLKLPDFGPLSQDRWAIQLIRERRALDDILEGRPAAAIEKVRNLWASLPGAGYNQPERKMEDLLAVYHRSGGSFV